MGKGVSVPPVIQLLVTLQFFESGSILRNIGDIIGLHISTISRIVYRCSRALASSIPVSTWCRVTAGTRRFCSHSQAASCGCPHCVGLLAIVPPQGCEAILVEILQSKRSAGGPHFTCCFLKSE